METGKCTALLRRVTNRLRVASFGRKLYVSLLATGGLYAAILLTSRLLGVVPDWFDPRTLFAIPVLAVVLAIVLHRKPTSADAARAVDRSVGTKDLFLTFINLETSPGEFGSLVVRDAESKAASIKPSNVVTYVWQRRMFRIAALGLVLFLSISYVPQFDPFGQVEAAQETLKLEKKLIESKKQTAMRTAALKRDDTEAELSKEVERAVEDLKSAFKSMKPREKQENLKVLSQKQGFFGAKWQKLTAEKLKSLLDESSLNQKFGLEEGQKLEKWSKQLAEGKATELQKELLALQKALEELQKADSEEKREALKQEIEKRLQTLAKFAEDKANSKPLAAALKQALRDLDMSKLDQLSEEACEACKDSLGLAALELEQLAQSARDLEALEKALEAMQMAKRLNAEGQLDGEACENCTSLADYAELYAQLMAGMDGNGDGLGGEGMGRGDIAPEDDSIETGFQTEQSKSAVTAGKILLSTKTKGMGEEGEAKLEYQNLVRQVKQGVSEAILQEQIPPGYHESIKGYFDTIERENEEKPNE